MTSATSRVIRRRDFLGGMGAGIASALRGPLILGAADKAGTKRPIVGSGEHAYEVMHDWGKLPAGISYGNTHGVRVDRNGRVFVHHTVHKNSISRDAMVVFDAEGAFVKSWGGEFAGGAHGLHIRREGSDEFLFLCDIERNLVVKTDINGKEIFRLGFPNESPVYAQPRKNGRAQRYKPTNLAIASNGDIYVGDGYGSSYINRYDKNGKFIQTIGAGRTSEPGGIKSPHGLTIDNRSGTEELLVADRANRRLQYFSLDGKHLRFVQNVALPCHFDIFKNGDLLIPDLAARVTILDRGNNLVAHLGEGGKDWPQLRMKAREEFRAGQFVCPHGACFDAEGNIFVVEWVEVGRVTKLRKVS